MKTKEKAQQNKVIEFGKGLQRLGEKLQKYGKITTMSILWRNGNNK